jgi:hypothetical protein
MALTVPTAIDELLRNLDSGRTPLIDYGIAGEIEKIRRSLSSPSRDEQSGSWAELAAFQFAPSRGDEPSLWNTYFHPRGGATFNDGSRLDVPDITQADIEILDYWKRRATEVSHPVLRARYADLAWDFSQYFKVKREVTHARAAIDAYLSTVHERLFERHQEAVTSLKRALSLALSINESQRVTSAVTAMLKFFDEEAKPNNHGTWSFIFDDLLQNKRVPLSTVQERNIIDGLERILKMSSTFGSEDFSPWDAQAAAERLSSYYHGQGKAEDVRRVTRVYGGAFEAISAGASSSHATAWLAPVLDAYRNLGMEDDAKRIHLKIAEKAKSLRSELKTISVPIELSQAEVDSFLETVTGRSAQDTLAHIAFQFVPRVESIRDLLRRMTEEAPLLSRIPIAKSDDDGFTVATVGPISQDPDGQMLLRLAQYIESTTTLLSLALERASSRYSLDADAITEYLYQSPVFRTERKELIHAGLVAHFGGDYVKAVHVLLPQIEEACRVLLGLLGEPVTRVKGQNRGILHQKNLNEILDEAALLKALKEDAVLYLKALLTEPIGLNVRNRLCHGLMSAVEFTRLLSDRIIHILLMLAQIRATPSKTTHT